jgi:hypothetical protein
VHTDVVGGECIGDGANGTWETVTAGESLSHLSVSYGGTEVPLT